MHTGSRQLIALAAAAGLALTFTVGATGASRTPGFGSVAPLRTGQLGGAGLRRLASARWTAYRATAGGPTIRVSPAYGDPAAVAQRWLSFFGSLLHGPELAVLDAYVAPLDEVQKICGGSDVLGCYGADHLVIPDQGADGIAATSIATHEYGHHVAFNRVNPPWSGIDWGPKRWATYERVCARADEGTAYPGAEDANYSLNPGEAWAETYRVLNETTAGLPITWPIVDPSFRPDAGALAAAREDVLHPWTAPTVTVKAVHFNGTARSWTAQVAAPLDGELNVQVQPGSDDLTLMAPGTRTPLALGAWNTTGAKEISYRVCGERTLLLRVTRHAAARRFSLRVSLP